MIKRLQKYISLILILALLFSRVSLVIPVLAEDPSPTNSQVNEIPTIPPIINTYAPPPTVAPIVNTYTPPPTIAPPSRPSQPQLTPIPSQSSGVTPTGSIVDPSPTTSLLDPYPTGEGLSNLENNPTPTSGSSTGLDGYDTSVNDPANTNTGPKSLNEAYEQLDKKMETLNKNLAEVNNKVNEINSTGFNYANLNSLSGQVISGDTVSSLNLLNKLNSNMTGTGEFAVFNVYDTYVGDIVFKLADVQTNQAFTNASNNVSKNAVTGPGSTNVADSQSNFTVKEVNGNDATLNNDIVLKSQTGNNTANLNTGDGNVTTGEATTLANIVNLANTNITAAQWLIGVVNIFGDMVGNIILPKNTASTTNTTNGTAGTMAANSNTGAMSDNTATFNNSSTDSFQNANSAKVTSNVDVSANTGNNTASVNTGGGGVTTGNSNAAVSNSTIANQNTIDEEGTVWMVFINEAGKWVGHIIGNPYGDTAASNSLNIAQEKGGAGTQVYNAGTGTSSTNDATHNQTSNSTVTNENNAKITNNVTAVADTGNNESSYNTGKGTIDTGDANVGLNLVNMVNTNVVAKKFIAIFVNVIGNFVGDVVTPDQQTGNTVADSSNTGNNTGGNIVSATPTPTTMQSGGFTTDAGNIGGVGGAVTEYVDPTPTPVNNTATTQTVYYYYYYPETQVDNGNVSYQPIQYKQSVSYVNYVKKQLSSYGKQMAKGPQPAKQTVENQIKTLQRGIFMSPAFAKATQESSIAGMLLGGASFRVTESWLSIVPLAFIIFVLRRRRKFHLAKYINALLDIVL